MEDQGTIAPCAKLELVRPEPPSRLRQSLHAAKRTAKRVLVRPKPVPLKPRRAPRDDESLGLHAGDVVEVKSAEEIRETLDDAGMYRGLYFMGEMWKYAGRRMEVLKPIERILIEATGELKTGIRDTVLLKDACCDGEDHSGCGANCFHLWREVWLRHAEPADDDTPAP
jgi:hypothetical protein